MGRVSNNLIGILNFLTFLLSIPILGAGIWLAHKGGATECEGFLQKPVIALGVFLLVVSLAGLVGACFRVSWLLWVYLLVMFLLIVLLFCFTIFAFVVTNPGAGKTLSNRGYKEYRLGDYSNWLQKRVGDGKNWNRIKSCLIDGEVCRSMATTNATTPTVTEFYAEHLSAVQSGCCKPSDDCNFDYVSPNGMEQASRRHLNQHRLRSVGQRPFNSVLQLWLVQGWSSRQPQARLEEGVCRQHHILGCAGDRLLDRMLRFQEQPS